MSQDPKSDPAALAAEWLAARESIRERGLPPDVLPVEELRGYGGLEFFQKMLRGEIPPPPIAQTLDFSLVEAEKGRVVFQGHPGRAHYNPIGSVHGGYHATLLDSCLGCAVQSCLEAGQGYTTIELKVNYLRALSDRVGPVRAVAAQEITDGHQPLYRKGPGSPARGPATRHALRQPAGR